jgi:predicted DNA-binding ribbon-helix-helix protein
VKTKRGFNIFGHPTSLALEAEYWRWLKEIAAKIGVTLKQLIEAIAAHRNYDCSLASNIRVAVAAFFHGGDLTICRCPAGMVPMRDGSVVLGWPGGRRRAQQGPRPHVDLKHGTRRARSGGDYRKRPKAGLIKGFTS